VNPDATRCRRASYTSSAPATATFNDSTGACMGIVTRSSHPASTSSVNPGPSPPTNSNTRPPQSSASGFLPPRGTDAMVFSPNLRAHASSAFGCTPDATGSRRMLPMLPRTAFQANGCADAPHTTAPVAPPASAARSSAPRLPGSCTSTGATTNASEWRQISVGCVGVRVTMATIPDGVRTGLSAPITGSVTAMTSTPSDSRSAASSATSASLSACCEETATCSNVKPAVRASCTRCTPSSSSRVPSTGGLAASSRNTRTRGF
jgi:hypothetical protein